jgi:hypothetical protein
MWPSARKTNQTWNTSVILEKKILDMSYHLGSSMAFRSNGLGYRQRTCILCRNKAILWGVLPSRPHKTRFPFSECRNGYFYEAGTEAQTTIEGNPCITMEEHLRKMFHKPARTLALQESIGSSTISLWFRKKRSEFELCTIFTLLLIFFVKSFLALELIIFCDPVVREKIHAEMCIWWLSCHPIYSLRPSSQRKVFKYLGQRWILIGSKFHVKTLTSALQLIGKLKRTLFSTH